LNTKNKKEGLNSFDHRSDLFVIIDASNHIIDCNNPATNEKKGLPMYEKI
jgi:hypothetical protein